MPMSPRRYQMKGKLEQAEATRRRILEATLRLHGERGIFGTSWKDIAAAADVAVGTVYRHFPDLDALVPACGELLMERTRPPAPEDVAAILGDAATAEARLERIGAALFGFYDRGGVHLETDARERSLPAVQEWEAYQRATVAGFVAAALPGHGADVVVRVSVLFDLPTWRSMRLRGLSADAALATAVAMAMAFLEKSGGDEG
jgi:AcrR family transcriptional regulator